MINKSQLPNPSDTFGELLEVLYESHEIISGLSRSSRNVLERRRLVDLSNKLADQAVVFTVLRSRIDKNFLAEIKERVGAA